MTLERGDELVKKRGGATNLVRVVSVGKGSAVLEHADNKPRRQEARTWPVSLDESGLPEGYRRVKP